MSFQIALKDSLSAFRSNIIPAIVLQFISLLIILSYFYNEAAKAFWTQISDFKQNNGVWVPAISTALFGGVIPALIKQYSPAHREKKFLVFLTFMFLFWAYKGIEVNYLYDLQALMFGDNNEVLTVVLKVIFDQFVYVPTIGAFTIAMAFVWQRKNYRGLAIKDCFTKKWYLKYTLPLIISSCFIWIPSVSMIYCLPLSLQLPVQNIILCFWSLIVIFLSHQEN